MIIRINSILIASLLLFILYCLFAFFRRCFRARILRQLRQHVMFKCHNVKPSTSCRKCEQPWNIVCSNSVRIWVKRSKHIRIKFSSSFVLGCNWTWPLCAAPVRLRQFFPVVPQNRSIARAKWSCEKAGARTGKNHPRFGQCLVLNYRPCADRQQTAKSNDVLSARDNRARVGGYRTTWKLSPGPRLAIRNRSIFAYGLSLLLQLPPPSCN